MPTEACSMPMFTLILSTTQAKHTAVHAAERLHCIQAKMGTMHLDRLRLLEGQIRTGVTTCLAEAQEAALDLE